MVRMSTTSSSEDLTFWRLFKQTSITRFDIFFLGITGILSSVVNTWTYAAHYGIWILLTSMFFPTIGYVLLTLCGAEMTSALPFSGGIYGAVRAFTTPLLGFVVAMFELVLNVSFVSSVVYSLGSLPVDHGLLPESMILVNCLITYLIILAILLVGGKIFWLLNTCLGLIVLTLLVIYLLGSSSYANFDEWGQGKYYHTFEAHEFMQQIPMVSTCFLGIQLIPLTSRCAPNPKKDIPIVMCILIVVCIVVTLAIMITAASQYPGIDGFNSEGLPLTYGFSRIFNISLNAAMWLNVPFLFATAFTFIFFCGRQASCMSKSGLIPEIFQQNLPILDTPYVSLLTFVFINFVLNIITFFNRDLIVALNVISSLSSFIVYILAFVAYIQFHKKYSSLERFFASPFGDVGAYVGILIFVFCFIGAAIFQETIVPIVTVIVIAVFAVIYYLFLSGEHIFSEEEREELFKAYLINGKMILVLNLIEFLNIFFFSKHCNKEKNPKTWSSDSFSTRKSFESFLFKHYYSCPNGFNLS